jgi:predicted  nucleic acid-binding Zn-ribbon protein
MDFWTAIVCIVGISVFGKVGLNWVKNRRRKVSNKDLANIQADLDELKTQVNRIHEYITDIYIQQYDSERAAKRMTTEAELYQDLKHESE